MKEIEEAIVKCGFGYPLLDDVRVLQDSEPCDHIGCRNHISHPCEGCGRIACKGTAETSKDKHVI